MPTQPGSNFIEPTLTLEHAKLKRSDHSHYRSVCPTCKEGILPCRRSKDTGLIESWDTCLLCAQHVSYSDFEQIDTRALEAKRQEAL